ncbi:unnamed protein product, partial [Ectocarpus sp. 4 AP-2014]
RTSSPPDVPRTNGPTNENGRVSLAPWRLDLRLLRPSPCKKTCTRHPTTATAVAHSTWTPHMNITPRACGFRSKYQSHHQPHSSDIPLTTQRSQFCPRFFLASLAEELGFSKAW